MDNKKTDTAIISKNGFDGFGTSALPSNYSLRMKLQEVEIFISPSRVTLNVRSTVSNHGLILSLETENVVRKLTPGFSECRVNVVQDVLETVVEAGLRLGLFVEITGAVPTSVDVFGFQCVPAVHGNQKLPISLSQRWKRTAGYWTDLDAVVVSIDHQGVDEV